MSYYLLHLIEIWVISQKELNLIINELNNQLKELKEENIKLQEMLNNDKN